MLEAALQGRLCPPVSSVGHAPLVVLSDSLLQPALPLLRSFVHQALSSANVHGGSVVLLCAEQQPHRLLPPSGTYDAHRVRILDGSLTAPYLSAASTSSNPSSASPYTRVNLSAPQGAADLVSAAEEAINATARDDGPVLVVLDSANALADELEGGVQDALRVVKACLAALKGRKAARLVLVHHDDLPPCPSPSSSTTSSTPLPAALLPTLTGPSLSPSTLHLTLRAPSHLHTLAADYALPLPSPAAPHPDPRAHGMLRALAARAVGDPLVRPAGAEDEDERAPLGGGGGGRAVVEWSARGVEVVPGGGGAAGKGAPTAATRDRAKERERAQKGQVPRVVTWGMCGAVMCEGDTKEGGGVREVPVWEVVDPVNVRSAPSPLPSPSPSAPTASSSSSAAPTAHPAPAAPSPSAPLTFSLSDTLTPSQLAARAAVPNPFASRNLPIYGEQGYVAPVLPGAQAQAQVGGGAGGIEYTPDRGDDWDEEDPDGDLEL